MQINVNEGSKEVTKEIKLWTGLTNVKVILISPTMDELKGINFAPKKDPVYTGNDDQGRVRTRIDFFLANEDISLKTKVSFWLQPHPRMNKDGNKYQFINSIGQTTWCTSEQMLEAPDFFSREGARKALIGEEDLIRFIQNWCNVESKDPCGFGSLEEAISVAKGNLAPIKGLLAVAGANPVKVLLGVRKDGSNFYQSVYTKYFGRSYSKGTQYWIKALENQFSTFKDDYQNSLELKVYAPNLESDTPTNEFSGGGDFAGTGTDVSMPANNEPVF